MVERGNRRNATGAPQQGVKAVKHRAVLLLSIVLPLAACGSKPAVDEKNASVADVAEKVREVSGDGGFISPGQWESTVTIEDVSMPGLPPEAAERMKKMVAQNQTTTSCLTPEEVKKPEPGFFGGNDKCRYDHFTMGKGKIDAEMHCAQGGMTQVMQMTGTYSSDAYTMQMASSSRGGPSAEGNMSMKMKVDAKRVGECTGKES